MIAPVCAFLSSLVILATIAVHPSAAACPRGWWLPEGVRRDGYYVCRPIGEPHWVRTPRGGWNDDSPEPAGFLAGRVDCNNWRPVTTDGVTVHCER